MGDAEQEQKITLAPHPGKDFGCGLNRVDPQINDHGNEAPDHSAGPEVHAGKDPARGKNAGVSDEEPTDAGNNGGLEKPETTAGEPV